MTTTNNIIGGPTENPQLPLPQLHPNLGASNVFGNGNKVEVNGNADTTNVVGNGNKVGVLGNRNITSVFGDGNKVTPKKWNGAGIEGDNNITTSFGNQNRLRVFGNGNLTTNFGNRSTAEIVRRQQRQRLSSVTTRPASRAATTRNGNRCRGCDPRAPGGPSNYQPTQGDSMKTLLLGTAIAAGALILAPAAAAAMPTGDYDFNLPGLQGIPVHIEETGFESIKLTTPNKFKVEMTVNRAGTRYEGVAANPHGAMCRGDQ